MKMLKLIAGNGFLRQNAILLGGALVVGFLNYLFYPVVGRLLDPTAFGEVQAIFSLFLQLTIFLAALGSVVVFIVANYKNIGSRNGTVLELEKAALWVALAAFVAMILFGEWLKTVFKFESPVPFWLLGVTLVVSVPLAFRTAFLRGKQRFIAATVANLSSAVGKFLFSVPLVLFGLGANGVLAGVAIAQAGAFGYSAWRARRVGLLKPSGFSFWQSPRLSQIWPELKYSLFVLAGSLSVMMLLTIDTIVVKYWFDPHTAGLYAGVATVARTIFFLTAPIVMALLPSVSLAASAKANLTQLMKSLVLFMAVGLPLLAVMVTVPNQFVSVLMGAGYAEVANLLPPLATATFFISLISVVVSYFLALKRYISALLGIISFAATFGLMCFHHGSLQAVVESLFVGSMVSMCLIAVWVTSERLTSRRSNDETTTTLHRGTGAQRSRKHSTNLPSTGRDHE